MSQPNDLVDHPRINWIVSKSKVDKYFIFDIYHRFEGNYEGHECLIELKDVRLEDAGQWKCEMESYVWGIARGYTRKRAIEVTVHDDCRDNQLEQLKAAVLENNTTLVGILLKCHQMDINFAGQDGNTALFLAAREGHHSVAQMLLEDPRTDVNKACHGFTPLLMATWACHPEVVKFLLGHPEVDVNNSYDGKASITIAIDKGYTDIVELLLAHPDVEVKKGRDDRALILASARGLNQTVSTLINRFQIDVNIIDSDNRTPLYWASLMGHPGVVRVLLESPNVDVNKGDDGGWSPLLAAVHNGYFEVVEQLLAYPRTNVNEVSKLMKQNLAPSMILTNPFPIPSHYFSQVLEESNKTAMWIAYDKDHQQILELLLSNPKVDVNVVANKNSQNRQTLLTRTVEDGNSDLMRKILEHPGVDVNKARLTYNVHGNSRERKSLVRELAQL